MLVLASKSYTRCLYSSWEFRSISGRAWALDGAAVVSSSLSHVTAFQHHSGAAFALHKPLAAVCSAFVSPRQGFMKWIWCSCACVVHSCILELCPGRWRASRLALTPQLSLSPNVTQDINKVIHSLSFLPNQNAARVCYQSHSDPLERP